MHWLLKVLLVILLLILFLVGLDKEMNDKSETISKKIINIIEMVISVMLIYFIYNV